MAEELNEQCTSDCSSCGIDCPSRGNPQSFLKEPHKYSNIKKVIAVVSGKGGVGKSLVTSLLAVEMRRRGKNVGIMDADITGPSVPQEFGIHERAMGTEDGILPTDTKSGIKIMSMNLLLEAESAPVVWRGPVIGGVVTQFWTDVMWGDIDYLFVDMPPGTGDVPLTVFQSLPVDGIIIVTSPQELVSVIVEKAVNMAEMMDIPILALVENMSYFRCPDCGGRHRIFGDSHVKELAEKHGIKIVAEIPIDPQFSVLADKGAIEDFEGDWLSDIADRI